MRIVGNSSEEKKFYEKKLLEASSFFKNLVIQAVAFNRIKEYSELVAIHTQYKKSKNVDEYINSLNCHKSLLSLGTPPKRRMDVIKLVFNYIKSESKVNYSSKEEKECIHVLTRLVIRTAIFDRPADMNDLFKIGDHFRVYRNIPYFKACINPYLHLLSSENNKKDSFKQ